MTEHKFKIGQLVYFFPRKSGGALLAARGPYRVLKRLLAAEGEFQSVIRSIDDTHERVVRESELSRG